MFGFSAILVTLLFNATVVKGTIVVKQRTMVPALGHFNNLLHGPTGIKGAGD
jgi:hypothetical protein